MSTTTIRRTTWATRPFTKFICVDILYWRNIAGNTIAETDSAGATNNTSYHEYVFFAGRRIARADYGASSFTVYYYFVDHLGSTRSMTSAAGSVCFKADYLPYGAENTPSDFTDTCSTTYKFTGYERDSETGLDYAFARYYNARLGRFMSGDPLAGDSGDPQSLNRYAYVGNNPINMVDPTGLYAYGLRHVRDGSIEDFNLLDEIDPDDACFWYGYCNRRNFLSDPDPDPGQGGGGGGGGGGGVEVQLVSAKPQQDLCAGIGGSGGVVDVRSSRGQVTLAFNSSGFLNGFSVPLTGPSAGVLGDARVPANTRIGARLDGPGSITIASSNSILVGSTFGAVLSSASFSGGAFTGVTGNIAVLGVPIPGTSLAVRNALNANAEAVSTANALTKFLEFTSFNLSCESAVGLFSGR